MNRLEKCGKLVTLGIFLFLVTLSSSAWAAGSVENPDLAKWAFLSAAIVTGLGTVGAGIAVGYVGSAAVGAMSEKPEIMGKALIYVGLAEGIAIYGLIIAIMILGRV
jgi:V/A-type H+/Na+-transporting ATPase subunit K